MSPAWQRPDEYDHVVVVAHQDAQLRDAIGERLEAAPGRARALALGSYPRFRVLPARDGAEALRLVKAEVSVLALDLDLAKRSGLQVIQELRPVRSDLAILAFTSGAAASEAVAAVLAGADHFLEYEVDAFEPALELAIDRRRLARLILHSEAEMEEARRRLARLGGSLGPGLPGLRAPTSAEAIMPFHEAAKRYLTACTKLFPGDPRGLAERLGVSYFALRRLLKRYGVPFPGRTRSASRRRQTGSHSR
ncbi:MAG TPA: response regulator [Anaeromyxobacteraceae bacterium]|nr:response regulator [Anaeromyxobacteraceae bacterium]